MKIDLDARELQYILGYEVITSRQLSTTSYYRSVLTYRVKADYAISDDQIHHVRGYESTDFTEMNDVDLTTDCNTVLAVPI